MSNPSASLVVGQFPQTRLRRNRQHGWSRKLMAENHLNPEDLIWPVFVREESVKANFKTMPGVKRYLIQEQVDELSIG